MGMGSKLWRQIKEFFYTFKQISTILFHRNKFWPDNIMSNLHVLESFEERSKKKKIGSIHIYCDGNTLKFIHFSNFLTLHHRQCKIKGALCSFGTRFLCFSGNVMVVHYTCIQRSHCSPGHNYLQIFTSWCIILVPFLSFSLLVV